MSATMPEKWLLSVAGAVGEQDRTLLHRAVDSGEPDIVQAVLQLDGISINAVDRLGRTAFMLACDADRFSIAQLLLHNGASISVRDNSGNTPLMLAAKNVSVQIAEWLIEKGCDVNATNKAGESALLLAARCAGDRATTLVQLLLANHADVNVRNNTGTTAHMMACQNRTLEVVQQLVTTPNIAVNARDNRGQTALMQACNSSPPFRCSSPEIVRLLLEVPGIEINAQDNIGFSALMHACHNQASAAVVRQLLQAGAEVNCRATRSNRTALDYACERGDAAIIKLLLEAKATWSQNMSEKALQHLQAVVHDLADAEAVPRHIQEAVICLAHNQHHQKADDVEQE